MVPIQELSEALTIAQKYFIERVLELVNNKTIDTYRARLHNPKTILQELLQVLLDWENNKLKRFETVKQVIDEAFLLFSKEDELDFSSLDKEYFISLLTNARDKNYKKLTAAVKLILHGNSDYVSMLFNRLTTEISICNANNDLKIHDLISVERLLSSLITELLNLGYSKTYLNNSLWSIFIRNSRGKSFDECLTIFTNLKNKEEEEYSVVFKLIIPKGQLREQLKVIEESQVIFDQQIIIESVDRTNDRCKGFLEISSIFSKHLLIKVKSKDYYIVIEKAKEKLSYILDQIFLGFNQPNIKVYKEALVIGTSRPHLSKSSPVNYKAFGSYISNQSLYEAFQAKLNGIYNDSTISNDAKQKIKSSVRYLRLGNDATEPEQKFLNYWIGLEFIFSTYIKDQSSFSRLIQNFPNIHQLIYFKRNLREFHEDIKRLNIDFPFLQEDYTEYLSIEENYAAIIERTFSSRPILAMRAYSLKSTLFQTERRMKKIKKHRNDLEWNLSRVYRIRNEIVHDAALKPNIERISTHIRYYLTFMTIGVIEYFVNSPFDINSDRQLSIDDFFVLKELEYESINKKKFGIDEILKVKSPVEIFTK